MSEGPSETGPVPTDPEQPSSPADSIASQRLFQQQVQQHYLQQQQHLQQQVQQQQQQVHQVQKQQRVQQQQQAQQQQPLNPPFQNPNLSGFLGQIPCLGLPYDPHVPPGPFQGSFLPGQGMPGMGQPQMPIFSEPMNPGAAVGQLPGLQQGMLGPQPHPKQKLHQQSSMVGNIPASAPQQDRRLSGGSNASLPLPHQANFGMVGQLPDQYLKARTSAPVGQIPQLQQQASSFGFPHNYMSQPLNLPLASAGMSLASGPSMSNVSQYSLAQPYGMFPHGPTHSASHVGSLDGSAYNVPDSASVMSQHQSVVQPAAPGPVVSLASLGTVTKVSVFP